MVLQGRVEARHILLLLLTAHFHSSMFKCASHGMRCRGTNRIFVLQLIITSTQVCIIYTVDMNLLLPCTDNKPHIYKHIGHSAVSFVLSTGRRKNVIASPLLNPC